MEPISINGEVRFWFLRFLEFGCCLHAIFVVQAKLDPFHPLLLVIILERDLNVSRRDAGGSPGLVPSVRSGLAFLGLLIMLVGSGKGRGVELWSR